MAHQHEAPKWKLDGVRVVKGTELDVNTAQTPGMNRAAAITHARTGARSSGRHGGDPSEGEDRRASPWPGRERDLRGGRAKRACAGATSSSSSPRPGRATSSTCRRTCRTRRSTPATASRSRACSAAAGRSRWWSISTSGGRETRRGALGGQHSSGAEEVMTAPTRGPTKA